MRIGSPWSLVVLVAVLALGGCSGIVDGQEQEPGQTAQRPSEALVRGPQDRDPETVVGSLLSLDPCELIVESVASDVDFPAILGRVRTAPHACAGAQDVLMSDNVTITLGTVHAHESRYQAAPITIARARAYRMWMGHGTCHVDIPVSFERSINVSVDRGIGSRSRRDVCPAAEAFATAAVRRLVKPNKVQVDPAASPLAHWHGCALLGGALGADRRNWHLALDDGVHGVDGCLAMPKDASDSADEVRLMVFNGTDPAAEDIGTTKRVGDATVSIEETSECYMQFSAGSSKVGVELYDTTVIEIRAPSCGQAEQLTVGVQDTLAEKAPKPERPSAPLTYRPTEPDSAAPGACVDFATIDGHCQPYQQVEPPAGAELLSAAAADPDVLCAVAIQPVREMLGAEFQPVTYGEFCVFVEPTHQMEVRLSASPDYAPDEYGADPQLYQDRRAIDIAGHPAVAFVSGDPQGTVDHAVFASAGSDAAAKGFVAAEFSFRGPRGDIDATAEPVGVERLPALLSEIMTGHFDA